MEIPFWGRLLLVTGPSFLVGAAITHAFVPATQRKQVPSASPACALVTNDGGIVQGVEFIERYSGDAATRPNDALPLVVGLHDASQSPEELASILELLPLPARLVIPRAFDPTGWLQPDLWPEATDAQLLEDAAAAIAEFLRDLPLCRPTAGLPLLVGYGKGGDLAYAVASEASELVRRVIGAAGSLPSSFPPVRAPTTFIHGRDDEVALFATTRDRVIAMLADGAPITWVPMTGVTHSFAGALQIRWLEEIASALASTPGTSG